MKKFKVETRYAMGYGASIKYMRGTRECYIVEAKSKDDAREKISSDKNKVYGFSEGPMITKITQVK